MSQDNELHEGVKLITARMESHPEEFDGLSMDVQNDRIYSSRWGSVIREYWSVLSAYEQATITTSLREANRKNFHSAVMKTILAPSDEHLNPRTLTGKEVYKPYHQMELTGLVTANEYANAAKALGIIK
jgi:hypothetical protein